MIYRFITILFLLIGDICYAQIIGLDLLGKRKYVEIPFELEQDFIMVKVQFQNVIPLKLIFDTGAENTILFDKEITQLVGVKFERQITITGSDLDSALVANIARNTTMQLQGCQRVKRDIIVLEENTLLLNEKLGINVNGILGGSFFSNLVVSIDYKKRKIRLTNPNNFKQPSRKYHRFDIDVISNKPYVPALITNSDNTKVLVCLLVDTGASLPFLVHTNTDKNLTLPDRLMIGNVGFGLSGMIKGYMGNTKCLQVGEFVFNNIATSFQDVHLDSTRRVLLVRNGILGNSLLKRFGVIIDYTRQKLYLRGYKKYDAPFEYDKSGLTLFAVGANLNQYFVVAIIHGSPAHKAGIIPGDIILKIGWRKTKHMTLEDITRKLAQRIGKLIKMTLIRDGNIYKTEFRLHNWYDET